MKKIIFILFVFCSIWTNAQTANEQNINNGLALQGYDPVAYFEDSKAIQGKEAFSVEYMGARYQFSSETNKALFLKNPSQYEPQYGGYCAFGMSNGYKAPIQPEAFTIVNNKLYLNYNSKVKEQWLKEQTKRIEKANENWEKLIKK